MGRPGRPGLGRPPGLAKFPNGRPPLGLSFASASAGVCLPGPSDAHAPFLFYFSAARWARARPLLCSASQRPGGDGVGVGVGVGAGEEGGRRRGSRPSCAGVGKKGTRRTTETCSIHELRVPRPA